QARLCSSSRLAFIATSQVRAREKERIGRIVVQAVGEALLAVGAEAAARDVLFDALRIQRAIIRWPRPFEQWSHATLNDEGCKLLANGIAFIHGIELAQDEPDGLIVGIDDLARWKPRRPDLQMATLNELEHGACDVELAGPQQSPEIGDAPRAV